MLVFSFIQRQEDFCRVNGDKLRVLKELETFFQEQASMFLVYRYRVIGKVKENKEIDTLMCVMSIIKCSST